ncbi:DUF397 domain-containing protein [Nocardia sp. NEAU-G5]|uniref:DUF397 domain-containing protein n=1 Tax=Nocardia albiluteola TaxID=2842303 RepID=A0ABS6B2W3_9NOCA|nr:DUF397 domain-containing protein [Nocardia albiluteola]MBU3064637.1 DUF397 domain-containing protein [Nocardia albiluteola]
MSERTAPRTPTQDEIDWRKSSYSGPHGNCVELARFSPDQVVMRNSRDPDGPVLTCTRAEFAALVRGIKEGGFDGLML